VSLRVGGMDVDARPLKVADLGALAAIRHRPPALRSKRLPDDRDHGDVYFLRGRFVADREWKGRRGLTPAGAAAWPTAARAAPTAGTPARATTTGGTRLRHRRLNHRCPDQARDKQDGWHELHLSLSLGSDWLRSSRHRNRFACVGGARHARRVKNTAG